MKWDDRHNLIRFLDNAVVTRKQISKYSSLWSINGVMESASVLLLKLALLLVLARSSCQFACRRCCHSRGHKEIDEPRRSIKSIWKTGKLALCDRSLSWGWYRFASYVGGQMPTSPVQPNRCGTVAPVWLNGNHPSVADGTVTRRACINFLNINNGCVQSFDIGIRNCSTFYVYFLRPTYSCAVAYCAGKSFTVFLLS